MYLNHLAALAVSINYISFFLSVVIIFKKSGTFDRLKLNVLKTTSLIFWILSVLILLRSREVDQRLIILYILIQITIQYWFWASSKYVKNKFSVIFNKEKPIKLSIDGPYRRIRHPFYTIYMCTYISTALILHNPYIWVLCLLLVIQYFSAAKNEEESFLKEMTEDYLNYRKKTWMFIPYIY